MTIPRVPSEEDFVMVSPLGHDGKVSNSWDDDSVSDSSSSEDIGEAISTQPPNDLPNASSKEQEAATSANDHYQQDSDGPSSWSSGSFMACAPPSTSENLSLNTSPRGHDSSNLGLINCKKRQVPVISGKEGTVIEPSQQPAASRSINYFVPILPPGQSMHEAASPRAADAAHSHNQLDANGPQTFEAENRNRKRVDLKARIASLEKQIQLIDPRAYLKSQVFESQLPFLASYVTTDKAKVNASLTPDGAVQHWPEKAAAPYDPVMTSYGKSLMLGTPVYKHFVDSFAKSLKGESEVQENGWETHQDAVAQAEKVQHDKDLAAKSFADQLPIYTVSDDKQAVLRLGRLEGRSKPIKNYDATAEISQTGQVEASARHNQTERRSDGLFDGESTSGRYTRVVDSPQCRDSGLSRAHVCRISTCGPRGESHMDDAYARFKARWGPCTDRSGLGAKPTLHESWLCSWGLLELAPRLGSIGWARLLDPDRQSLTDLLQANHIDDSGMLARLLEEIKAPFAAESQSLHARPGRRKGPYSGPIPGPSLTPGEGGASVDGTAMHNMREIPSLMPGTFPGDDSVGDTATKDDQCPGNQSNHATHADSIPEGSPHVHDDGIALPKARRLTHSSQVRPATRYEPFDKDISAESIFQDDLHALRPRYVNWMKLGEIMLVTNGTCTFKDAASLPPTSTAGASFIFEPTSAEIPAFRLETKGPQGDVQPHTSNRAKLRAALAALEARPWASECCSRVVVLTDLEYVARGATEWISLWAKRRWRSAPRYTKEGMFLGKKIANRDLWEQLQARVDALREAGTEVAFWLVEEKVAKKLLRKAKRAAREAATTGAVLEKYNKNPCGSVLPDAY